MPQRSLTFIHAERKVDLDDSVDNPTNSPFDEPTHAFDLRDDMEIALFAHKDFLPQLPIDAQFQYEWFRLWRRWLFGKNGR